MVVSKVSITLPGVENDNEMTTRIQQRTHTLGEACDDLQGLQPDAVFV
jgi:hypothetical protein